MWPSRAHIQLVHIVSIINGIYDPIGLASPMTIRLRVAFRNLFEAIPRFLVVTQRWENVPTMVTFGCNISNQISICASTYGVQFLRTTSKSSLIIVEFIKFSLQLVYSTERTTHTSPPHCPLPISRNQFRKTGDNLNILFNRRRV